MADRSLAVRCTGVRFAWPGTQAFAIAIADFALARGERVLLVGPSGAGKSTLLSLLSGVLMPQEGSIGVLDTDVVALRRAERDRFRGEHFGILFQMFNLLPYASVLDNVLLPLQFAPARRARAARRGSDSEARRLLRALALDEHLHDGRRASALSVGQQQRVAAARALIGTPEIVIADEPTSALDRDSQLAFLDLLFAETTDTGASVLMVSHDASLASRFDRVVALADVATVGKERPQ